MHTLEFDLILDNKGFSLGVDCLVKLGGYGVVSSLVLDDETLVANHALEDGRLLNRPFEERSLELSGLVELSVCDVAWKETRMSRLGSTYSECGLVCSCGGGHG